MRDMWLVVQWHSGEVEFSKEIFTTSLCHMGLANQADSLNKFLTRLRIRHLSSIAECQFQNGLSENGGWVLECDVRHDKDLSGLGPMFEEFSISLNAQ